MFLDMFNKYNSQYEKGIRKISFRSSYPKLSKKPFDLTMEKSHGNFELFFNRKGLLLHSVHAERNRNYKVIYGYDHKGVVQSAMSLVSETNELISTSEYEYDDEGRIETETVYSFYFRSEEFGVSQCNHSYKGNFHEVLMTSEFEDEEDCTFFTTYDDKKRIIEEKVIRGENELIYWKKSEYDMDNSLIKELSFDEKGEPDGVYKFFISKDGMTTGYIYESKEINYKREYVYINNEKGHWINQVLMKDGEPRYFYDRILEYY